VCLARSQLLFTDWMRTCTILFLHVEECACTTVGAEEGKALSRGVTPAVAPPRANIAPSRAGGMRRSVAELEVRVGAP